MLPPDTKIKALILEQANELDLAKDFAERATRHLLPLARTWHKNEILVKVVAEGKRSSEAGLAIVQSDRPFVVSSLRLLLDEMSLSMRKILHPIVMLETQEEQKLSLVFVELERPISTAEGQELTRRVKERMREVRQVVADFPALLAEVGRLSATFQALGRTARNGENDTTQSDFLDAHDAHLTLNWLMEENFIFLGHSRRPMNNHRGTTVDKGLVKSRQDLFSSFTPQIDRFVTRNQNDLVLLVETLPFASPVHRDSLLNTILVVERDTRQNMIAWHVFYGIWTSSAIRSQIDKVPFIRSKVARITKAMLEGPRSSARINFFRHQTATYSWDGFARLSLIELKSNFRRILQLVASPSPRVVVHPHHFLDSAQIFLLLPRERYNPEHRRKIIKYITKTLDAKIDTWNVNIGEGMFAHLSLNISYRNDVPKIDPAILEKGISECLQLWRDSYLRRLRDEDKGAQECHFPASYQASQSPGEAVADTLLMERATKEGVAVELRSFRDNEQQTQDTESICVVFAAHSQVPSLTNTYPMLQRMGLPIAREEVHDLTPPKRDDASQKTASMPSSLVYFYLDRNGLSATEHKKLLTHAQVVAGLLQKVWLQQSPDDIFNSLCWKAELSHSETFLWRTVASWTQQIGSPFSLYEQASLLLRHPAITKVMTEVFINLHDPNLVERPSNMSAEETDELMRPVENASEDALLRNYLSLIYAIERTNYFVRQNQDPFCIKIATKRCEFLKHPRPYREIFMEHKDFKAVHMRFGPISRGGIRWSDRLQDFRDEVLGLVKAQHVKNTVIVPVGSKGGFVLKQKDADPATVQAHAIQCYKTYITTLLKITDNQTGKRPVHPKSIVCRDGYDPYLVVAADKGTASFSDHANEVARSLGYWLDDAFASGGSQGYDHKAIGITARGAWESVKQHFSSIDVDPEKDPISVVGIGDMSGDVFGNGMLLSKSMKLIAAFNHRSIFFNPDPDPETCYQERKRLFALPRSSWSDYDPKLISDGGGVFDRSQKRLTISEILRTRIGAESCEITPNEFIQRLLTLDVDLLWFGGIGTYIKAAAESHHNTADPANNACRVNAEDLRCRVVAEGANLGITQKARVIYCRGGGFANTDSVDNSAGVNCSDHEVNIKILLSAETRKKTLTKSDRNKLLRKIEPDVAQMVLRTNKSLALSLSLQNLQAVHQLPRHRALIQYLEGEDKLDRELEHLPDSGEIDGRLAQDEGLTRPEMAILLAYAKIDVETTLHTQHRYWQDLPVASLLGYFPPELREQFRGSILSHPLAGQILATVLINEALNIAGCSFFHDLHRWLGFPFERLVQGYVMARDIMGFDVSASDGDADWYARLSKNQLIILGDTLLPMTAFFTNIAENQQPKEIITFYTHHLPEIIKILAYDQPQEDGVQRSGGQSRSTCWFDEASVRYRLQACYVLATAQKRKLSYTDVAQKMRMVGRTYGFDVMTYRMSGVSLDPAVEAYTRYIMIDRLYRQQARLACSIVETGDSDLPQNLKWQRFMSVSKEILMMQNTSTEQMILWQEAVEKHLHLRKL